LDEKQLSATTEIIHLRIKRCQVPDSM